MPKKTSEPVVEKEMSDDEEDQVSPAPAPEPEPKKKYAKGKGKERTPAQKEAFAKALDILKQKREAKANDEKQRYEKANAEEKARIEKEKYEKAKNHKKRLPPAPSYVTTGDLEKFKNDLLSALPMRMQEQPKPVETPKKEPVVAHVEPVVVPKKKTEPVVQKALTGHDLIDKLFFT